MTAQDAQTFGRTKTLKATGFVAGILLVVFMLMETSGDFANGILFFIEAISNGHFLAIMTILLGLTFLFGGMAGKEIIIKNKHYLVTSVKYALLIFLAIIIYTAFIVIIKDKTISTDHSERLLTTNFLTPLAKTSALTIIPLLAIWLWATDQMRLKRTH